MPEVAATNPEEGVAPEADAVETDHAEADEPSDEGDPEGLPEGEEEEEVDYEGEKYRLPKKLKDALLRQADYTRKTQEVSEKSRSYEAKEKALQEREASAAEHRKEVAQLQYMTDQLEEFDKLDWQRLMLEDKQNGTNHTLDLQIRMQQLQNQRNKLAQTLQGKHDERISKAQREDAKALEDMRTTLQKETKGGWSLEKENSLKSWVVGMGLPAQAFDAIRDPTVMRILDLAQMQDKLLKKQAQKPAAPPPQPLQPLVKAKNRVNKDPDKMSIGEWKEWRKAGLRKQRP